ncbi:L-threonate dehydrogenase [uncultured Cohaesibacter sp.]|uniref:L-threonate dehydrogenase n=1 Tax=uncultured Cohaesibacter sp. TaxID=1002546 RepID=UPI003749972F
MEEGIPKMKVAAIGLGSMGYGMAKSLVRAGHDTYGFDIVPERMQSLVDEGGKSAELNAIAPELDAAVLIVLNAAQTEAVLVGEDGILPKMKKGAVVMSCATVAPDFARAMEAKCSEVGVLYVDAPISGGAIKAAQGQLSILSSATPEAYAAAEELFEATAETVFRLGDCAGAGSAMKAVNQMLAGIHIAAMGEAITFGMTQGVEPASFVEVISKCAGTSWMLENRAPHVVAGDYTPHSAINIWLKDLGIVLDIAKGAKFGAPITAAALQQYLAAAGTGLGFEDDAAIAKVYARNAGITLPGMD